MIWLALIACCIFVTVARARQQNIPWDDIAAFASQWFHFVCVGGEWGPTFSSCVGLHVRDGHRHRFMWRTLRSIIDFLFLWKEYDHCDESLYRLERPNGPERYTKF